MKGFKTAIIGTIIRHIKETVHDESKLVRCKLVFFTHRKSYARCPLVPKWVTLNDLERWLSTIKI